jgi:hypothetical protein
MGEQRGALRREPLFDAGRCLRGWRARPAFAQFGLLGCQVLAGAGHRPHHRFHHLGDDMKLADLMPHLPEHLLEGFRIERRAIGGDTAEGQATGHQGRF